MAEIPEEFKQLYASIMEACRLQPGEPFVMPSFARALIERIAAVIAERDSLKEQVSVLSAPVSRKEVEEFGRPCEGYRFTAKQIDALIRARLAGSKTTQEGAERIATKLSEAKALSTWTLITDENLPTDADEVFGPHGVSIAYPPVLTTKQYHFNGYYYKRPLNAPPVTQEWPEKPPLSTDAEKEERSE